jgi:hypothetical protein
MAEHAEDAEHPHPPHDDPEVRAIVAPWWEQRREFRAGSAWDVPFPPMELETARVTAEVLGDGPDATTLWRACLMQPRAITAYIEVESKEGPIAALVSLYQHVV